MKVAQLYLSEENSSHQYNFCISHKGIEGFTWWAGKYLQHPNHITLEEYLAKNTKAKLIGDFNETE